jgi:SprT protein
MRSTPEILKAHVPENAIGYATELWRLGNFFFKLSRDRETKLGDYSFDPTAKKHTITINKGLNQYSFLVTYLHEVAHLVTTLRHGVYVKAHGEEWQSAFKEVMYPVLKPDVFPEDILIALHLHMFNDPSASSCADITLMKVLGRYDKDADDYSFLEDLGVGDHFMIKQETYEVERFLKKRAICFELRTGKKYYVPNGMKVKKA